MICVGTVTAELVGSTLPTCIQEEPGFTFGTLKYATNFLPHVFQFKAIPVTGHGGP
jgi:hypothetical protein